MLSRLHGVHLICMSLRVGIPPAKFTWQLSSILKEDYVYQFAAFCYQESPGPILGGGMVNVDGRREDDGVWYRSAQWKRG